LSKAYYEAKKDGSLERPGTRPSTQKQTADSKAKAERKNDGNIRRTRMASTDEGHIPVLLADICALKVLADSGADDNVMSHLPLVAFQ
jgi:Tfp pilus assembly major pilin PilA